MSEKFNCPFCQATLTLSDLRHGACSGCGAIIEENSAGEICFLPAGDSFSKSADSGIEVEIESKKLKELANEQGLVIEGTVLKKCTRARDEVKIPVGITKIDEYAFNKCKPKRIIIPNTVVEIGEGAFCANTKLVSVQMADSVKLLGSYAFGGCTALTDVSLSSSLDVIEEMLFDGCTALREIDIPSGVCAIEKHAFYGCSSLKEIDIPDGVYSIKEGAFSRCSSLEEIVLPSGVTIIENNAFSGCTALRKVDLSYNLAVIGDNAFRDCASLERVYFPSSLTSIGKYAFNGCKSLKYITLNEGIEEIGYDAFSRCLVEKLTIPKSVKKIEDNVFDGLGALKEVELLCDIGGLKNIFFMCNHIKKARVYASGVEALPKGELTTLEILGGEELGFGHIGYFHKLESVTIPRSIKKVGECIFDSCPATLKVRVKGEAREDAQWHKHWNAYGSGLFGYKKIKNIIYEG